MKKSIFIAVVLAFTNIFAQTDLDSLEAVLSHVDGNDRIPILNELASAYVRMSPEKSLEFAREALTLSQEADNKKEQVNALVTIGSISRGSGNYEQALDQYREALALAEGIDYRNGIAQCLTNIGVVHDYLSNYEKALDFYLRSLRIREEIGDKKGVASSASGIGIIFWYLSNYETALEYHARALGLFEEIGDFRGRAATLNNIGLVHSDLGNFDSALTYYSQSYDLNEQIGEARGMADASNNIGMVLREGGNYHEALPQFIKSLTICRELGYTWGIAGTSVEIGKLYLTMRNYDSARHYLELGLNLANEISAKDLSKQHCDALADLYTLRNDYERALRYHILASEVKDSIYTEESGKRIAEMQARYETEKKEKEIAFLSQQRAIQELELGQHRILRNSLVGACVAVFLLAVVMYNRYRLKTKANVALAAAMRQLKDTQQQLIIKEKMSSLGKLVAGLAHEMNSPIGAIKSSTDNMARAVNRLKTTQLGRSAASDITKDDQLQKTLNILVDNSSVATVACDRVTTMVKSLKTFAHLDEADFKETNVNEDIDSALTLLGHELDNRVELVRKFGSISRIACYPDQLNQVFMNLLFNAAEAIKEKGTITVETSSKDSNIAIRISDTGEGIPAEHLDRIFDPGFTTKGVGVGTGLGLSISYEIIRKHGGSLTVESEIGRGTAMTIILPLDPTTRRPSS